MSTSADNDDATELGPTLHRDLITRWGERYMAGDSKQAAEEEELLTVAGPEIRERGYYRRDEVLRVSHWKAARNQRRIEESTGADVELATRRALAAPEHLRVDLLDGCLRGVGPPVASALLTIVWPDRFTVLDFRVARALETLEARGQLRESLPWSPAVVGGGLPPYLPYRAACLSLADRLGVRLRDLDRALWQWDKEGLPQA